MVVFVYSQILSRPLLCYELERQAERIIFSHYEIIFCVFTICIKRESTLSIAFVRKMLYLSYNGHLQSYTNRNKSMDDR